MPEVPSAPPPPFRCPAFYTEDGHVRMMDLSYLQLAVLELLECKQAALEGQDLPCTYLAPDELESVPIISIDCWTKASGPSARRSYKAKTHTSQPAHHQISCSHPVCGALLLDPGGLSTGVQQPSSPCHSCKTCDAAIARGCCVRAVETIS